MLWPWISRSSHEMIVGLLRAQVVELTRERTLLLERLLGPVEEPAETEPEIDEIAQLMNLRRRPSKLADALTRKAYRDYNKGQAAPSVMWMLDEAEASGKNQT
jgi:HEPN domain-containing protein